MFWNQMSNLQWWLVITWLLSELIRIVNYFFDKKKFMHFDLSVFKLFIDDIVAGHRYYLTKMHQHLMPKEWINMFLFANDWQNRIECIFFVTFLYRFVSIQDRHMIQNLNDIRMFNFVFVWIKFCESKYFSNFLNCDTIKNYIISLKNW